MFYFDDSLMIYLTLVIGLYIYYLMLVTILPSIITKESLDVFTFIGVGGWISSRTSLAFIKFQAFKSNVVIFLNSLFVGAISSTIS